MTTTPSPNNKLTLNDAVVCDSICINYQDVLDYATCSNIVDQLCCSQSVIEQHIDMAIELVEEITGIKLCPYIDCKKFDGDGSKLLYFNPVTTHRLLSLTEVTLDGCCENQGLTTSEIPQNFSNWLEYKCAYTFPCGSKNIQVCGSWGTWEEMPKGLKEAVITLVLERVQPGITGIESSQGMAESVKWDDFSITYNTPDLYSGEPTTGYLSIDRILKSYIPTKSQIKFAVPERQCPKGTCEDPKPNNGGCNQC
jgi:hypothetical protein